MRLDEDGDLLAEQRVEADQIKRGRSVVKAHELPGDAFGAGPPAFFGELVGAAVLDERSDDVGGVIQLQHMLIEVLPGPKQQALEDGRPGRDDKARRRNLAAVIREQDDIRQALRADARQDVRQQVVIIVWRGRRRLRLQCPHLADVSVGSSGLHG